MIVAGRSGSDLTNRLRGVGVAGKQGTHDTRNSQVGQDLRLHAGRCVDTLESGGETAIRWVIRYQRDDEGRFEKRNALSVLTGMRRG